MIRTSIFTAFLTASVASYAIIPVYDAPNHQTNMITAFKAIEQVANQVQQYQLQLKQYQDMLKNSASPKQYVWDQINDTMNKLVAATDTLDQYKDAAGSLDNYLQRYQDVDHYEQSPCFGQSGCTESQWQQLQQTKNQDSAAIKRTNDALFHDIDQQQSELKTDTANLSRLQAQAGSATGRMQALAAANQLASAQANQLVQIRQLMLAQQTAEATKTAVANNQAAITGAADKDFAAGTYTKSQAIKWKV